MFKKLIVAAGFVLASLSFANASSIEHIKMATYELYENTVPICSGQFVTPTEFLTAAHCLDDLERDKETKFYIQTEKDHQTFRFELKPNHINKDYDTATLVLVDTQAAFPFVSVAENYSPTAGDNVISSSYPEVVGYLFIVSGKMTGIVEGPEELGKFHYVTSITVAPGSSGGGLYVNQNGDWKLIGTTSGGHSQYFFMTFFSVLDGVKAVI